MNIKKVRAIISSILVLSGLVSFITGAVLYFLDYGMWLCFTRKFLNDTHAVSAVIMFLAVSVHFILNIGMYRSELKSLFTSKSKECNN